MIIDSQVHVWTEETPDRPWPQGGRERQHLPYALTSDKMLGLMDEAGVDRAIIVPPSWEGDRNDYALAAAQQHPDRFAVMGRLNLAAPDARQQVTRWLDDRGMLGVRLNFTPKTLEPLRRGEIDWFWSMAETAGLPVMAHTAVAMPEIMEVVKAHPKLRLIIDHMGLSSEIARENRREESIDRTVAFADFPNVAVKLSNAPTYSHEPYPFADMAPLIHRVVDAFGFRRCFWGTDVSHSLKHAAYGQNVTMFTEEMDFLPAEAKDWIMGRGVAEYLGWKP